jgi:hypothetical protein
MTSQAKIDANRRNAARSTGPLTAAGKIRSGRNAYRHGLTRPLALDDQLAAQIEALADEYVAATSCPHKIARSAAEQRFNLLRIQRSRVESINNSLQQRSNDTEVDPSGAGRLPLAIIDALPDLVAFDRYERDALAQCKKAFRRVEAFNDLPSDENLALPMLMQLQRLANCHIHSIVRPASRKWEAKRRNPIVGVARLARKYIICDNTRAAIDHLDGALYVTPSELLLHAVRTCALLISDDPEGREALMRYRGRVVDDVRWEAVVLDQLRQLRKAPRMPDQLIGEVERMLGFGNPAP